MPDGFTFHASRVDIARERQNQALLASMDRRGKAPLRLQQAVEGLSVAAIVCYAAGLASILTKGAKSVGVRVEPDLLISASIPLRFVVVFTVTRRGRCRLSRGEPLHRSSDSPGGSRWEPEAQAISGHGSRR